MSTTTHEELVEIIRSSIDYHENEREGGFRRFRFCFSAPEYDQGKLLNSPECLDIVKTFEDIGAVPQPYDTLSNAFNLNRDYWMVSCDKCIREYGFTLPVSEDLEALARIVEYEHSGAIQFIVYDLDEE